MVRGSDFALSQDQIRLQWLDDFVPLMQNWVKVEIANSQHPDRMPRFLSTFFVLLRQRFAETLLRRMALDNEDSFGHECNV